MVLSPKSIENFTEFYFLDANNEISNFPEYIYVNDDLTLSVGIINHEFQEMEYTIEFWLIEQDKLEDEQSLLVNNEMDHMWFLKKESIILDHFDSDNTYQWDPQWVNTYDFSFDERGTYKLMALLQTDDTMDYNTVTDYKAIYDSKISDAYREIHVWVQVI